MKAKGKVLLIVHDVYQDDNVLPLGAAYLAAALKAAGAEVTVYSQDVYHYSNEELADFLSKNEFDLIGVGFMAARFKETIAGLCEVINEYKKKAYLVLGGHGPSPIPEYMLNATKADVVAMGEAEETIVELLQCKLAGAADIHKVKGIAYSRAGKCYVNPRRAPVKNLDEIALPQWDLFPIDKYADGIKFFNHEKQDRYLSIITSRGCVNSCSFCYRMEKGFRLRSMERIVEEMALLNKKFGINSFPVSDELFIFSKQHLKKFRDILKANKLKIKFSCNVRVDLIDEELLGILKESGCQFLNFGMESTSQNVLNLMNKRATVEQNHKAAELTKKTGMGMGLNFLWGNIGDTEETLKNNVAFIKKYNTYHQVRTIRPVTPYPGCALYYEAINKGLLSGPQDFFEKFKNSDLLTVNFTDIPEEKFYELLFEANKELITDHHKQLGKSMETAAVLIEQFRNLYFTKDYKFRGARHHKTNN